MLKVTENKKRNWLGHCLSRDCLLTTAMEGVTEAEKRRARRRMKSVSYTHLDVYKRQILQRTCQHKGLNNGVIFYILSYYPDPAVDVLMFNVDLKCILFFIVLL